MHIPCTEDSYSLSSSDLKFPNMVIYRWELPGGAGNSQQSCCADWQIRIDSNTSNSFGLVSCTDHVEKAILWISGSPLSVNFRKTKLKFGQVKGTSLIDWMLVFYKVRMLLVCRQFQLEQDELTGRRLGAA